jgi:hypothetical protein
VPFSSYGEVIAATLKKVNIAVQAVQLRVDAAMIEFHVQAEMVATNADALKRLHFFYNVEFRDGETGDDGLVIIGEPPLWDEVVFFLDGVNGDDGLVTTMPIEMGDETVFFTEDGLKQAYAISNTEFVTFRDFSIRSILDFLGSEQVNFADMSIAWQGQFGWAEQVTLNDTMTAVGGNSVALSEHVTISETFTGGPAFIFGDAVVMAEAWWFEPTYPNIAETVSFEETSMKAAPVAGTDSRPGAFVPGQALLGSAQ